MAVPLKYIRYIAQLLLLLMVTRVSAGPEVITRDSRAPDYGVCKARNSIHQYSRVISLTLTARRERESLQKNNDTEVCGDLKRPELTVEPQTWQPVNDRKVIVFSAFYEDRVAAHGPSIRVIASGWQRAYREVGPLFCQLWFGGRNYAASVGPAMYDVIYPSTLFPEAWSSHFIICPLPKVARLGVPYAVSITPTPCETPQNQLLVLHRTRAKAKKQHAVCYPPMYNYFSDWKMVVEMFEMHKLLGADHIVIYNLTATPITNKALLSYIQDNRESVDVVQWPFPFRLESNVNCQRGALNDCLYRTRNQYRYVSVHDLDEVLMPRSRDTWPELMRQIVKPEYGAFMFQHYYFRRNLTLPADPYLITQTSFYRTDVVTPPGKIRCKSMYDTDKALKLDLHFPYELVAGAKEYLVDPAEGALHHYRVGPMTNFKNNPENYRYVEDRYAEKYKSRLVKAYLERLSAIQR